MPTTDPDPDPDHKNTLSCVKSSKTAKPIDPRLLQLAKNIRAKQVEASKMYTDISNLPPFDADKAALELGRAIRIDKIPVNRMLDLWDWIIANDFWRKNMLSIQHCRKNSGNGPKILQCWNRMNEPPRSEPYRKSAAPDQVILDLAT